MNFRLKFCFVFFFGLFIVCEGKYGYVVGCNNQFCVNTTDYFSDIPDVHIARATYSNDINETGWAFLEIHSMANIPDEKQAFGAGFLEGYLTRDLIWWHWQNMLKGYCFNKTDVCGLIEEYIDRNEKYISDMVRQYSNDPYWYQVKLYYIQIEGLAAGYKAATEDAYQWLTVRDIVTINLDFDGFRIKALRLDHRAILSRSVLILERDSSKSSCGQSTDDFYIISSGLVSAETTIGNSNRTLFEKVNPIGTIMEFVRAMIANRLARSGKEWVHIFRKHNSGTYNNQWYIVDYKKFRPRTQEQPEPVIENGLLYIIEQLPGYTEAADLTLELKQQTYFPSYNIPYFPGVFNLSGGWVRVQTYGDWFGYHTNPRAKIIKEKQGKIRNLRDMYYTMRYNDFKHDPLSRCSQCNPPYSGCNAIAARNDLNPANGTYPFRALGHRSHGATDVKITSATLYRTYSFLSVSSPTHNISRGIPPFAWSEFDLGNSISHVGHPDVWLFSPLLHQWEWE
ncbi:putative phospholipase B-like 2 [Hyposmocoma kahamanoa]|uniref:putative phospholipase B-like 2 n=1 Tax=Hyposmocoma kahamanoa TaxID=1477025 RepID=UPI000E6D67D9|nr:putative phospholipase B-like 2 [Hyposmocoma kahamanoa]